MPSFDRLLVLAVIALSASVQSAPVGPDTGYGIIPTEGGLLPAPGVDQGDVVPASGDGDVLPAPSANEFDEEEVNLDARDFDEEDEHVGEDDEDLETRDYDEDDEDLEVRDFDGEEADDLDEGDADASDLERRAASKKTKAAPKPKPTKAPKPKTTKAAVPKPKTTKAKTTKAKTTAKATKTTKPVKTTKAAATAKASKTPKLTKTKISKTAKATGTATPSACPIKKPTKKPRTFAGRAYDYVAHLFERDNEEFVGWHGTNSDTAAFWASKGHIEKPTKPDGFLDFLGIGTKAAAGTSGADAEIGPGLYVADNKDTGILFANINAGQNKGTTPMLCAIFARESGNWENVIRKAFIPETLVGDSSDKTKAANLENARLDHIKKVAPGVNAQSVVKFALFDRKLKSGQMVIPQSIGSQFSAKCFKVQGDAVAESDAAASNQGTNSFPNFSYNGAALRAQWRIEPETPAQAQNAGGSCS